jgi:hypothetical protein
MQKFTERHIPGLKENNYQPRLVYPAKLFFLIEREVKNLPQQAKTKGIHDHKPALQKILKGLLHTEEEIRVTQEDARKNKPF